MTDPTLVPLSPPRRFAGEPPVAEALGPEPEDFVVEELPAFGASGAGEHWLVEARKRRLTTAELLHEVARAAGVAERDLGHAGMKDRHAVTTQWLSVPARGKPPDQWELPANVTLVGFARHDAKLRTGHLAGNRFTLTLDGTAADGVERARERLDRMAREGLPNYFGAQRFGRGGDNLAEAAAWLEAGAPPRGRRTRLLRKLYPSVIQSEIFNRYLARRGELGLDRVVAGDVVRLDGRRAVFLVEDPAQEQPRLDAREIHLTGPMPGPKMRAAAGVPLELEAAAFAELGLAERAIATLNRCVDGTRRDLLLWPTEVAVDTDAQGRLVVRFALPPGAYATQVLRELVASPAAARPPATATAGQDEDEEPDADSPGA
jgi:tRNA pseudouridine13 synthase